MKATGERCDRCLWQKKGAERVAAVDRCQGAPSTQADVGHRNRDCSSCRRFVENRDSKKIRRTLRIKEGDPLQTTLTPEGRFCMAIHSVVKFAAGLEIAQ